MPSRWVPVFQGSIPEVITLQASFEADGIPTYVPDMNLIQADPFMRGGNALALELLVPEDRIEDARALVPVRRKAGMPPLEDAPTELELLGRRVRWCIVLLVTAPFGIWFGIRYLRAAGKLEPKPAEHAWTVASFWMCLLITLTGVVVYGNALARSE